MPPFKQLFKLCHLFSDIIVFMKLCDAGFDEEISLFISALANLTVLSFGSLCTQSTPDGIETVSLG
jgi:hypothetical protein